MIVEVKNNFQITIPTKITKNLGIKEGDKLNIVTTDNGCIYLYRAKEETTKNSV